MKPFLPVTVFLFLGHFFVRSSLGQQTPTPPPPHPPIDDYEVSLQKRAEKAQWNVNVDVQMIAIPMELALPLLPDLQGGDQKKIEAAVEQIQDLLQKKQATLMAWPSMITLDGLRTVSETTVEKRYPTEFAPPPESSPAPSKDPANPKKIPLVPTNFETRNLGATLEVEPFVVEDGHRILLNIAAQRIALLGFDTFDTGTTKEGNTTRIDQPQFADTKVTTTLSVHSGDHTLLGVHKLTTPENHLEFFILRATATKPN